MGVPYYGDFAEDDTVDIIFNTFTSNDPSASSTITDFINTDVHIHKDGGLVQRNNAAGITVSANFDGITGNHLVKIDTSDDTVAAFWVTGSEYQIRIEGTTVDGATINAWIGSFSIERAGGVLALLKGGSVDVNTKTITAGIIANASFNADVGSTAHGTNIIALACRKILEELNLDHLLKVADADDVVNDTVIGKMASTDGDWSNFAKGDDSLQSIRDRGDSAWVTATGFALASVVGALADAAAAGEVTEADTLMQYIKQILNVLIGAAGIGAFPAEAAPANAVSLAEVIRAIHADVTGLNGSAMVGTDGANTTVPDAAGTAPTVAEIQAELEENGASILDTLRDDLADGGRLDLLIDAIKAVTDDMADSASTLVTGTVEEGGGPTTTEFQTNLAEATNDHYNGRIVIFLDNNLKWQASDITDYVGATGTITVTAMTEAPAAGDTFVIV